MGKKDEKKLEAAIAAEVAEAEAQSAAEAHAEEVSLEELLDEEDGAEIDVVATLRADIETAKAETAAQADKYLRLMAEFDNVKRRHERDAEKIRELAAEKLMGDLIDVRENFQRALAAPGEDAAKIIEGLELIAGKFDGCLATHGLSHFGVVGEVFDPELHDAMMRQPHDEVAEDHIVQVFEKGYKLKSKVIRHAKVVVSSGKA